MINKGLGPAGATYHTVCGLCDAFCGLDISVENGNITQLRGRKSHPLSKGLLCPKGRNINHIIKDAQKLNKPMLKTAANRWQKISWAEAEDILVEQLKRIKEKHGAHSVAIHLGHALVRSQTSEYIKAFSHIYGTPNYSTCGSHCFMSKFIANRVTFGVLPTSDYENSSCIVLWGYNPLESCLPVWNRINIARKRGAKLIVIDPRLTKAAEKADIHLQPRPGTDCLLALALLHVIINEKLYDVDFVQNYTIGFPQLTEHVKDYLPGVAAILTGVPKEMIKKTARLYAGQRPACITPGIALELHSNGFDTLRALSILQAITGNADVKGGALFPPPLPLAPLLPKEDLEKEKTAPGIGEEEYPLYYRYQYAQANLYARAILEGKPYPLKAMIVAGSNPVLTWPNSGRVKEALSRLEFLAVIDHQLTETAELAHLVLPVGTFWHEDELWNISGNYFVPALGLAPKLPLKGDAPDKPGDWQLWRNIVQKMGYEHKLPWETKQDFLNHRLVPLKVTVGDLQNMPDGYLLERREKSYVEKGFRTPSGKVELYSSMLDKYEYSPLPVYSDPAEASFYSPDGSPTIAASTGNRLNCYLHSRFRSIEKLRQLSPEPQVEINTRDAQRMGIESGDIVMLESSWGSIKVKANVSEKVMPGVVFIPHGWEDANANYLTADERLDPVTGFPPCRSFLVQIKKTNS
ncbi:MAG: molybdopterin-dependent oxidoreductase [Firmicutes bacterium]|nr:molybdopterin-dependent oxidoreductase [Bacillota bacterium]